MTRRTWSKVFSELNWWFNDGLPNLDWTISWAWVGSEPFLPFELFSFKNLAQLETILLFFDLYKEDDWVVLAKEGASSVLKVTMEFADLEAYEAEKLELTED